MELDKQQDSKLVLTEAQKEFYKELQKLMKPIVTILEAKPADPGFPEQVVKLFTAMRNGEELTQAVASIAGRYLPKFEEAIAANIQAFKRYEAAYLRGARERGVYFRETSKGWRVGSILMETNPALAETRVLYNREQLTGWTTVMCEDTFMQLERQADELLQSVVMPDDELCHRVWVSFKQAVMEDHDQWEGQRGLIQDIYEQFRNKISKDPGLRKKLGAHMKDGYPLWAFLHNLDRYRQLGGRVPAGRRLALQTGSQQEVSKGLGVTVGGLNPDDDYKTMCYLVPLG